MGILVTTVCEAGGSQDQESVFKTIVWFPLDITLS